MAMVQIYRYRKYDIENDEYWCSTRMATKARIAELGAMVDPDNPQPFEIDEVLLAREGWTDKNFKPS